jgi:AraC-like DNA-binding protein
VHEEGDRVIVQLDTIVALTRAAADFASAACHLVGLRHYPKDLTQPDFEVWFRHERPADISEYQRTFAGGLLNFGAPMNGFTFKREYLGLPMPDADPQLHTLISKHAEAMLAELPSALSLTERVRDLLAKELASGSPTLANISHKLAMSERTLTRHLEEEGTSFKALLEDLRHRLAVRYVRQSDLPMSEIAFLLGFSQSAAFYRAFRRWTGQTPLEYRQTPILQRT